MRGCARRRLRLTKDVRDAHKSGGPPAPPENQRPSSPQRHAGNLSADGCLPSAISVDRAAGQCDRIALDPHTFRSVVTPGGARHGLEERVAAVGQPRVGAATARHDPEPCAVDRDDGGVAADDDRAIGGHSHAPSLSVLTGEIVGGIRLVDLPVDLPLQRLTKAARIAVEKRGGLGLPVPIAVTVAYACAFMLSYVLNRTFNFQSHAPVGPQVGVYVVVVVVNYLVFILGVSSGLAAIGVHYQLSRLVAGICEAVYMYSAMRWVVFRR